MALAAGGMSYTPPMTVINYINGLSLIPALYATSGSAIILPYEPSKPVRDFLYYDIAMSRDISIIPFTQLKEHIGYQTEGCTLSPWGWNAALKHRLLNAGVYEGLLPSNEKLTRLRQLAHRSTTRRILSMCCEEKLPQYVTTLDAACEYIKNNCESGYVAKLPWSSSGRGVFFTPNEQMLTNLMRRQGGVVLEPIWEKALDFATEWICEGGKVWFQGYSLFESNTTGNYKGNLIAPQSALKARICEHCSTKELESAVIRLQNALVQDIAPYYDGPLGVDMLVDTSGRINPCVEVNMRMTMGHVALRLYENFYSEIVNPFYFVPGRPLPK